MKCATLDQIHWSQGLFGFVADMDPLLDELKKITPSNSPSQTPPQWNGDLSISGLREAYRAGLSPVTVIESLYKTIETYNTSNDGVWIHLASLPTLLSSARTLAANYPNKSALPPLFGIPFSVKDSIDIANLPTTTACPPLTHTPTKSAPVYSKCVAQGALFIGKTNLDQLATGLTGTRSPFGVPHCVHHQAYISGGSSSGSSVSVGAGLVSFSLGTDTAGSGRVPALFNGVVGFKPTRGLVSAVGVTPACQSLDCIAIIAGNVEDARSVWNECEGFDSEDPFAKPDLAVTRHVNSTGAEAQRFKFGVPPPEALGVCSAVYRRLFDDMVAQLQTIGGTLMPIDWSPFRKAGDLLYNGTLVSERLASLPDDFLDRNSQHLHPVIHDLFTQVAARRSSAIDAYRDMQAKALYTRQAESVFAQSAAGVDVVVVPTAPTHWTIAEVLEDPIAKNSVLGEFSHCANVLDLCAVAVPAGEYGVGELSGREEDEGRLPFGVTFLGGSRMDAEVLEVARRFEASVRGS